MKPLRILLASMPRMLIEMITQIIAKEPEFVIVGAISECSDLTAAVRRSQADLLIVGQRSFAEATDIPAVLSSSYPTKILTITESGQCGALHELRPHRETLVDISAASLVAAIRTAIGSSESKPNLQ
jgi:DNA-binding NarL/FixJ family response regulator